MTVRSINASAACANTVAKLDPSITVARTGESTMLLNLPRDIAEIEKAAEAPKGFGTRLRELFA
ncbi:hypothetical protein CGLAU_11880 [Corynebacterium glaucum]|uniref:Uncharacterized protein n=1 Tax=Corynebacterium glaucum TaxID=187491 RepID=A0A1Q2HZP9_9CORY|nr:hypothetical protein [Corynebacterium glaucum]AQQ16304.1 hypothetical protein CGLAU_11880 [Corynebacterium glaucum]WJZ08806.1 hypothetical protein CGLAUT_11770 [Corynebacterium glaucum]